MNSLRRVVKHHINLLFANLKEQIGYKINLCMYLKLFAIVITDEQIDITPRVPVDWFLSQAGKPEHLPQYIVLPVL